MALAENMGRELRHRKYKRSFLEPRPPKKLFTPEIKRYLKSWLVRRRNHPYPNRGEKKALAMQTGLTYMQICNWFANWRRKLKNTGGEEDTQTWTALIKTYNGSVDKNIEQFSLSSHDSIWEEFDKEEKESKEEAVFNKEEKLPEEATKVYSKESRMIGEGTTKEESQCFHISSTTSGFKRKPFHKPKKSSFSLKNKSTPLLLSRWLKSATYFHPKKPSYLSHSYFNSKQFSNAPKLENTSEIYEDILTTIHGRDELDAAEALTFLSRASRGCQKL